MGISAFAGSRGQALAGVLGSYFLFVFAWTFIVDPRKIAAFLVESVLGLGPRPELYDLVFRLSPATAYTFAGFGFISGADGSTPIFLQWWFMLIILLIWLVVPLTIGYLRFRDSELVA